MYGAHRDYGYRIGGSVVPPMEITNEDDPAEGGSRIVYPCAPLSALPMELRGQTAGDELRLEGRPASRIPVSRGSIGGNIPPTQTKPIQGRGGVPYAPTGKGPQFGSLTGSN